MTRHVTIISQAALPSRGGLAVATSRIAQLAAQRGEQVEIVVLGDDAPPGGLVIGESEGIRRCRVGRLPDAEQSLAALVGHGVDRARKNRSSLIHGIYASEPGYAAVLVAAQLGVASVVSIRGNDLDRGLFRGQTATFVHRAIERATIVSGVSRAACQMAAGLANRTVYFVGNSVDTERFRPETPDNSLIATLNLGDDPVIGFSGELREKKGLRFLLPAFAAVLRDRPAHLLLLGGLRGEALPAFEEFSRLAPDAAARIHVCEYSRSPKQLSRMLALCDLLVFPSLAEGMPNAMLEAMACARPILATDVGGHGDLLQHGKTGALLSTSELDVLPQAILEMLDSPNCEAMGEAAREYVQQHHRPEQESDAWAQIYAQARELRQASAALVVDCYPKVDQTLR